MFSFKQYQLSGRRDPAYKVCENSFFYRESFHVVTMDITKVFLLILGFVCSTHGVFKCKDGWVMHQNRCYLFSRHQTSWATASYVCAELGGSLAALETEEESRFIEDQVKYNAYLGCFNDRGNARLLDSFYYSASLTNRMCIEHCRENYYEFAGTQYMTQCFCGNSTFVKFLDYGSAPESTCNRACGGNKTEMCGGDWKLSIYITKGKETWVGGTDLEKEGDWKWFPSRRPLTYQNWIPLEPNNLLHYDLDKEHCLSLYPSGQINGKMWIDDHCNKHLHYICEMEPVYEA